MNLALDLQFEPSTIVLGIITGLGYGLLSTGLVIVFRTNRIINFAHGETGALGAGLFILGVTRLNIPYYVALPLAFAVGAGVGALAEVFIIRRLRNAPRLMSLVATLLLGSTILYPLGLAAAASARGAAFFPAPPGLPDFSVGPLIVHPAASGLMFLSPPVVIGLAVFLRRSRFGLALRSAAANPEAARMAGVSAARMSTLAWAIGGALSTFTAILVAPSVPGGLMTAGSFGPSLLMRGLAGAIIARMTNIPIALGAGVGIGVIESLLLQNFRSGGVMDFTLFVIILIALFAQYRGGGSREEEKGSVWASVQPWRPLPDELANVRSVRNLGLIFGLIVIVPLVIAPLFLSNVASVSFTTILGLIMVALSVGVVTGLAGQLTLGQFALAAVGAAVSAHLATRLGGNPFTLLIGGVAAAAATIVIGLPALIIRGLFLAVTTLSFAVAMQWVLIQSWALSDGISTGRPSLAGIELEPGRKYYYFALFLFLLLFLMARNIRRTSLGRLLRAVRDNEDAARAFGVRARSIKMQAFLLAGFIAGVGGAAYGHSFSEIGGEQFRAPLSIDAVVMTVVGGIAILAGPLLGILLVKGVPAFVPVNSLSVLGTGVGLLLLILYFPGGLVQLVAPLRERVITWLGRRQGVVIEEALQLDEDKLIFSRPADALAAAREGQEVSETETDRTDEPILQVLGVTKTYGGLTAVNDITFSVRDGETLGLIGPNGAGKTTLFEVLAGFVRADSGRVVFKNQDVTRWTPERRARAGLIRSFQDVSLFPTLTVLDTVQLAFERQHPTIFSSSVLGLMTLDRKKEALARDVVGSMGLWSFRNKQIQELSTGTRRITELACLVAMQPKVLLLDEPSSGIAQRETEALGGLLQDLKADHSMTLIVIEHDIPLIMGLAQRIIAMDAGTVIAEGAPADVRNHPKVIEAYLGGRMEAIERSGALSERISEEASEAEPPDSLASVTGLGPARQAALLEAFGSVEAIREASVDELMEVPGVGRALAQKVHQELSRVRQTT